MTTNEIIPYGDNLLLQNTIFPPSTTSGISMILFHTTLTNPEFCGLELANALLEHYLDEHIKKEVIAKTRHN